MPTDAGKLPKIVWFFLLYLLGLAAISATALLLKSAVAMLLL